MILRSGRTGLAILASLALMSLSGTASAAGSVKRVFASPDEAVAALVIAAGAGDQGQAVLSMLGGDDLDWISSGDPVQDSNARDRFLKAFHDKHAISMQGADRAVLLIGGDDFPFPFPIVKSKAGWSFAPELGKEELLNRRIGQNELEAIQVLLAIIDAQREYAAIATDGSGLRQYAQRFRSTPGQRDGLYWSASDGEVESPLGPLVAEAAREGYTVGRSSNSESVPYKGYMYRLLTGQGKSAAGGAYDYKVNGRMIGGFAAIAAPARYGVTGVMAFIVNHDAVIHEADLGPQTDRIFKSIRVYDPDRRWKRVGEAEMKLAQ
jgi:hypothetical protein